MGLRRNKLASQHGFRNGRWGLTVTFQESRSRQSLLCLRAVFEDLHSF
jgi:hypothetical protein